jgi:hypothetical protein
MEVMQTCDMKTPLQPLNLGIWYSVKQHTFEIGVTLITVSSYITQNKEGDLHSSLTAITNEAMKLEP